MICQNCGTQLNPGDRFCGGCGAALAPAVQPPAAPPYQAQPYSQQQYAAPSYPAEQYPAQQYPPPPYPAQQYPADQYPAEQYPPPYAEPPAPPPAAPPAPPTSPPAPSAASWHDHAAPPPTGPDSSSVEYSGSSFSSATTVPWGAPTPPPSGLIASVPGFSPPSPPPSPPSPQTSPAPEQTVGRTQGAADVAGGATWRIDIDSGESIPLDGPVVLGRNPSADIGQRAVAIEDKTRSVSKTHVRVELQDDQVTVTDLHSTNGVAYAEGDRITTCEPGEATVVPVGATVRFGQRELWVRR